MWNVDAGRQTKVQLLWLKMGGRQVGQPPPRFPGSFKTLEGNLHARGGLPSVTLCDCIHAYLGRRPQLLSQG